MTDSELQEGLQKRADTYAMAFDDPKAIAERLLSWVKEVMPERVSEASWIDVERRMDKGFDIRLYERPMPKMKGMIFRVGTLLGAWSYGLNFSTQIYESALGTRISVGLGAVAPYSAPGEWRLCASVSVKL